MVIRAVFLTRCGLRRTDFGARRARPRYFMAGGRLMPSHGRGGGFRARCAKGGADLHAWLGCPRHFNAGAGRGPRCRLVGLPFRAISGFA